MKPLGLSVCAAYTMYGGRRFLARSRAEFARSSELQHLGGPVPP